MKTALVPSETQRLIICERAIEQGALTFVEVGAALQEIRDSKLYRAEFKSFEKYCAVKWGWGKSHAYRLIDASKTAFTLNGKVSPVGDGFSEGVLRPMAGLAPADQRSIWGDATADGKIPTAKSVEDRVEELRQKAMAGMSPEAKKAQVEREQRSLSQRHAQSTQRDALEERKREWIKWAKKGRRLFRDDPDLCDTASQEFEDLLTAWIVPVSGEI